MANRVTVLRPIGGGTSAMRKLLKETERLVARQAELALDEIADKMVEEIKARAPVDTGNLEDAIDKHIGGKHAVGQAGKSIVVSVDESKAPYAKYMNQGMFDFYADGKYFLGPRSDAKNANRSPHEEPRGVGIRFVERGAEAAIKRYAQPTLAQRIEQVFGRLTGIARTLLRGR